jgi:hypothetical protein
MWCIYNFRIEINDLVKFFFAQLKLKVENHIEDSTSKYAHTEIDQPKTDPYPLIS